MAKVARNPYPHGPSSYVTTLHDHENLVAVGVLGFKKESSGSLGGAAVWCLPLAQGAILETRDRIPRQAPCMEPASPSACVSASLSLSL